MTPSTSQEFSKYVGVPYVDKGRSPVGWDCYGLYRYVYAERHGVLLPAYADTYASATDAATVCASMHARLGSGEWAPVPLGSEREGDGVVFLLGGRPLHCGYVIEPGIMLHALQGRLTCIERYRAPLWNKRIEGVYRWLEKKS